MFVLHLFKPSVNMSGNVSMLKKISILHKLSTWSCRNIYLETQRLRSNFHHYNCKYSKISFSNRTDFNEKMMKFLSVWTLKNHVQIQQKTHIYNNVHGKCFNHSIRRKNSLRTFDFWINKAGNVLCKQYSKPLTNRPATAFKLQKLSGCSGANSAFKLKEQIWYSHLTYSCHGFHTSSRNFPIGEGKWDTMRTRPPWRVLFFGTDLISLCTLKTLHRNLNSSGNLVDHLEVVTVKSQGQKDVPVYKFATKAGLHIHEWPIIASDYSSKYDVGVLVSFGHLIPEKIINLFPYGIINMHPSLLPRWRGASPIFHTVLNGDSETGVSISDIRPKHFDVGPILMQSSIIVPPRVTTGELTNQLADMGAGMVLDCLQDLPNLERLEHEQEPRGITYAHKVHPIKAGYVNWRQESSTDIDCHFRAIQGYGKLRLTSHLQNGEPVSFTEMVDPQLTGDISTADIQYRWGNFHEAEPGCIALHRKEKWLLVKCKDGMVGFTKVICRSHLTGSTFYYGYCNHRNVQLQFRSEDNQLNRYLFEEKIPVRVFNKGDVSILFNLL